jgi:cytochrome c-type biogenesis protein CcmF
MENLGALSLLVAFGLAAYAMFASVAGARRHKPHLIASSERAVVAVCCLLTLAVVVLLRGLLTSDFSMAYVAEHSNRDMPWLYKLAAWWSGQEGSLLLWSWLLACYSVIVLATSRGKHRKMMPYAVATLMASQTFFLALNVFVSGPFQMLAVGREVTSAADGQGLNPLLQYWAMAIHPPTLYLGYVGFAVPFALAAGALVTRESGGAWLRTVRRWTLAVWLLLSLGIILGAGWAYAVLGWGGYWSWDPVENASLLPWITATAFLHSLMMQEKRGMMKIWNVTLIAVTFWLCIFGTFLTRSGVVSSVHAFAQSSIGRWFSGFLALIAAASLWLILSRLDYLRSRSRLEGLLSRETSFLFNNLLLLASCFAVLWGTMFPLISEIATGEQMSVDALFFNRVQVPAGLALLLLTGVAPLLAWRRTSPASLKRNFFWPGAGALILMAALLVAGMRHFYALVCFGLCFLVVSAVALEFHRGARVVRAQTGRPLAWALIELTRRNTRRYGGYAVHLGIAMMFMGFAGSAFNRNTSATVRTGDTFEIGRYRLVVSALNEGSTANYSWSRASIAVFDGGRSLGTLTPERRFYPASEQGSSEVAIRRGLVEDLYLNFAGVNEDGSATVLQIYIFPLVSWIWIGFAVLVAGAVICLIPSPATDMAIGPLIAAEGGRHD